MTKRDIVLRISAELGLKQEVVAQIVQRTFDCTIEAVTELGKIEFRNFGVFEVIVRKGHKGRDFANPQRQITIPARAFVKFKPGKEMLVAAENHVAARQPSKPVASTVPSTAQSAAASPTLPVSL